MAISRRPATYETPRERRLLIAQRRREAATERIRELVPAICPRCRSLVGLAESDAELFCHDCGVWAPAIDPAIAEDAGIVIG